MPKSKHAVKPTKTQGDRHDVTAKGNSPVKPTRTPTPPTQSPRRTDAALQPKAPLEVLVSRAIEEELEWYFAYGDSALSRGDVTILPSYAAVRVLATEPEGAVKGKAIELALTVQRCLASLRAPHASVLRTAYTPRRWPEPLERAFESAAPIAVRLALAHDPWPPRRSRSGLEEAAAMRLSAAIVAKSRELRVDRLRARAERLLGHGVVAYATARALEGADLGVA
jgi:hypothetical protein